MEEYIPFELPDEDELFKIKRFVIADPEKRKRFDELIKKIESVLFHIEDNQSIVQSIIKNEGQHGYQFGSGNKSFDQFLLFSNRMLLFIDEDLIRHDVLTEIDLNLVEFKIEREKTRYLNNIKREINWLISYLEIYNTWSPFRESPDSPPFSDWRIINTAFAELDWADTPDKGISMFFENILVLMELLKRIVDYIDEKLQSDESSLHDVSASSGVDLSAFNHRLLLLHKLGLFKPLVSEYRNAIGPGNFAKLIGGIVGVPKESLDGFRAEVRKLESEIDQHADSKKNVQTSKANKSVDEYLASIGLSKLVGT